MQIYANIYIYIYIFKGLTPVHLPLCQRDMETPGHRYAKGCSLSDLAAYMWAAFVLYQGGHVAGKHFLVKQTCQ